MQGSQKFTMTLYMAKSFGKGIMSNTDTHTGDPGHAMTLAKGNDFNQVWENIKLGKSYLVRQDLTANSLIKQITEMAENLTEERKHRYGYDSYETGIGILDRLAEYIIGSGDARIRQIIKKGMYLLNPITKLGSGIYLGSQAFFGGGISGKIEKITSELMQA